MVLAILSMVKNAINGFRWTPPIDIIDENFTALLHYTVLKADFVSSGHTIHTFKSYLSLVTRLQLFDNRVAVWSRRQK